MGGARRSESNEAGLATGPVRGDLAVPVDDDRWLVGRWERGSPDGVLTGRLVAQLVAGLHDLWRLLEGQGLRLPPECRVEDLVHRIREDELDRLPDLLRNIAEVLLVLPRQDHRLRPGQVSGQDLRLQPADREHPPAERDLAG